MRSIAPCSAAVATDSCGEQEVRISGRPDVGAARSAETGTRKEVRDMTTTSRKDAVATVLTGLAVLTYFATHQEWNVWLVGDSRRWAAGVILVLGAVACGLGNGADTMSVRPWDLETKFTVTLGVIATALGITALVTGSLTPLSLFVIAIVALWAMSTVSHVRHHTTPQSHLTA
jgi:hypothetical protein